MAAVREHFHGLGDLPTGTGPGKLPLASSIRTGLINLQTADSTAVASTMTLTAFAGAGAYTLPANTARAGELIRVSFAGTFGITATPTLSLSLNVGGVVRGASDAVTLNAAGNWNVEVYIACGTANAARIKIVFTIKTNTGTASVQTVYDAQDFDPTVANLIQLSALWSASSASNTTTQVFRSVSREAVFGT